MLRRKFFGILGAAVAAPVAAVIGCKAFEKLDTSKGCPVPKVGRGWKVKKTFSTDIGDQPFTTNDNPLTRQFMEFDLRMSDNLWSGDTNSG